MEIKVAEFLVSNTQVERCPAPNMPEFAFIGRSNVGKSSLLNLLANRKDLAKTSVKPGKTQTINHFVVNENWYMVDLPGYGYARTSQTLRESFGLMIEDYILKRENLYCTFVLVDSRLEPQAIDLDFIQWLGLRGQPLAIVLTKSDKLKRNELEKSKKVFFDKMNSIWEELPPIFITSTVTKAGKKEILDFISNAIKAQPKID
jgi:GTP-binding protein